MYNRSTSNRLLYVLFFSQSLFSAATIAIATLMIIVAARISGDENVAGLPSATQTFSQALFAFPVAVVMGRFGRRLGLMLGYGAAILSALIGIFAITNGVFLVLILSAGLMGMARASVEQSRFAAGEIFPESERARMIGRLVFAGTIGAVVGPALVVPSGKLMETIGLHPDAGPWVATVLLCLIAAALTFFLLRPDPMTVASALAVETGEARKKAGHAEEFVRPLSALLRLPKVQLGIIAALVSQTVMVVLMAMTPLHMDHTHHGRDDISLVIAAHTLGMFGLSPLTGYLIDRFGRIPMLMVGAITLIVAALLAPVSSEVPILALALFLLGLGWNFGYVAGSSLLADALRGEERARVQGINDALIFLAAGFGSLGAGVLFANGGYGTVSLAGLVLVVALIAVMWWLTRPQLTAEPV
jgi:MFS family permease